MPPTGDYEPGTSSWSRKHVEQYEATNGRKAGDLRGRPVVVLTTVGAKTGKLRKTALMRVEHDYVAHEATGDEKAIRWERAVETWRDYAGYQKRTKRQIPVFVLEPME
jgi:hypothetical protein